jgi:PAS domain S-box-containing protein
LTLSDALPAVQNFDHRVGGTASAPQFGANDFESLFEQSGLCMVALNQHLVVQDVNSDFARELGWCNVTLRGRETLHFVHRSGHLHLGRQLGRLLDGKRVRVSEHVLAVSRSDEVVPARFTATAVHANASGLIRVLVILQPDYPGVREQLSPSNRKVLNELDAKILESVAAGVSSVQIASKLHLSRQGVEYHVSAMLRKLNAPNRAALVSRAYSMGVLAIGVWPPKVQPEFVK